MKPHYQIAVAMLAGCGGYLVSTILSGKASTVAPAMATTAKISTIDSLQGQLDSLQQENLDTVMRLDDVEYKLRVAAELTRRQQASIESTERNLLILCDALVADEIEQDTGIDDLNASILALYFLLQESYVADGTTHASFRNAFLKLKDDVIAGIDLGN